MIVPTLWWQRCESSCRVDREGVELPLSGWDAISRIRCTFIRADLLSFMRVSFKTCWRNRKQKEQLLMVYCYWSSHQKMKVGSFLVWEASTSLVPLCSVTVTSMNLSTRSWIDMANLFPKSGLHVEDIKLNWIENNTSTLAH